MSALSNIFIFLSWLTSYHKMGSYGWNHPMHSTLFNLKQNLKKLRPLPCLKLHIPHFHTHLPSLLSPLFKLSFLSYFPRWLPFPPAHVFSHLFSPFPPMMVFMVKREFHSLERIIHVCTPSSTMRFDLKPKKSPHMTCACLHKHRHSLPFQDPSELRFFRRLSGSQRLSGIQITGV